MTAHPGSEKADLNVLEDMLYPRHVGFLHYESLLLSCVRLFATQRLQPARLLSPWDSPGRNTGVGCHFLLQGTFLTQGWKLHVLHLLH